MHGQLAIPAWQGVLSGAAPTEYTLSRGCILT
jgi:hypothetical protein